MLLITLYRGKGIIDHLSYKVSKSIYKKVFDNLKKDFNHKGEIVLSWDYIDEN